MGKGGDVQLPSTGTQLSTSLTNVHMANLAGNTLAEARIDCTVALRGGGWFGGSSHGYRGDLAMVQMYGSGDAGDAVNSGRYLASHGE